MKCTRKSPTRCSNIVFIQAELFTCSNVPQHVENATLSSMFKKCRPRLTLESPVSGQWKNWTDRSIHFGFDQLPVVEGQTFSAVQGRLQLCYDTALISQKKKIQIFYLFLSFITVRKQKVEWKTVDICQAVFRFCCNVNVFFFSVLPIKNRSGQGTHITQKYCHKL